MNNLADGWRNYSIDEISGGIKANVVIGPFGSNLKVSDYRDDGVPLIFVRNVRANDFRSGLTRSITHSKAGELRAHQAQHGDVLITKMGDPPGDAAVYRGTTPAVITADCIRVRVSEKFVPEYVAYSFGLMAVRRQILAITSGVAQKKVSLARFRAGVSIPAPSLVRQQKIVQILEDHYSRLDAADEYADAARKRCETLVNSAILEDKLLGAARVIPLRDLMVEPLANGKSVPTKSDGFPVLRLTALKSSGILDVGQRKGGAWTADDARQFLVRRGDFMVSRGNGSLRLVARGGLVKEDPDPVAFPDTLIRIRVNEKVLSTAFLSLVWNSPVVRRQIEAVARTTAGIYKVNQGHLEKILLPVPSIPDQAVICAKIDGITSAQGHLVAEMERTAKRSIALRQAVTEAAYTGRLVDFSGHLDVIEEIEGV